MSKGHVLSAAFVALAVLLGSSGTAQAASQSWYLDFNGTISSVAPKGSPPEEWQVSVADGGQYYWFEKYPNTATVNLHGDLWSYSIQLTTHFKGKFNLLVGKGTLVGDEANPSSFVAYHGVTVYAGGTQTLYGGELFYMPVMGDFVINEGEHLMFMLDNIPDPDQGSKNANQRRTVIVQTGSPDSYFASPDSDPGLPTPELPTVLLMAAGVGLFGFVALRRRAA